MFLNETSHSTSQPVIVNTTLIVILPTSMNDCIAVSGIILISSDVVARLAYNLLLTSYRYVLSDSLQKTDSWLGLLEVHNTFNLTKKVQKIQRNVLYFNSNINRYCQF